MTLSFDEAMFILLCGTGVGFSVERQFVNKLPEVPELFESDTVVVVKDSKEGWAKALRQVIALLYSGEIPKWDVSKVRPAGARLKTFGGRASGPAPLIDLFNFVVAKFKEAQNRKLSSIECHDIMCKIGEVVVVGGVRRSAMISLSNLSDDRMRHAKSGAWWENDPQRALANNSTSYTEKPDAVSFMREWMALVESGSGERGIFNRQASKKQAAKNGRRDPDRSSALTHAEIILRPYQFCNLTEVVVRATDTIEDSGT
jgi:ribonucleoside-triphosphate reductase